MRSSTAPEALSVADPGSPSLFESSLYVLVGSGAVVVVLEDVEGEVGVDGLSDVNNDTVGWRSSARTTISADGRLKQGLSNVDLDVLGPEVIET